MLVIRCDPSTHFARQALKSTLDEKSAHYHVEMILLHAGVLKFFDGGATLSSSTAAPQLIVNTPTLDPPTGNRSATTYTLVRPKYEYDREYAEEQEAQKKNAQVAADGQLAHRMQQAENSENGFEEFPSLGAYDSRSDYSSDDSRRALSDSRSVYSDDSRASGGDSRRGRTYA